MAEAKRQRSSKGKLSRSSASKHKAVACEKALEPKPVLARPIPTTLKPVFRAPIMSKRPEYVKLGELLVRADLLFIRRGGARAIEARAAGLLGRRRRGERGGECNRKADQPKIPHISPAAIQKKKAGPRAGLQRSCYASAFSAARPA